MKAGGNVGWQGFGALDSAGGVEERAVMPGINPRHAVEAGHARPEAIEVDKGPDGPAFGCELPERLNPGSGQQPSFRRVPGVGGVLDQAYRRRHAEHGVDRRANHAIDALGRLIRE